MIIEIEFHGIPLTFDCEVIVEPPEKPSWDNPGCPADATVIKILLDGKEIDPDDDVWEAVGLEATKLVRKS